MHLQVGSKSGASAGRLQAVLAEDRLGPGQLAGRRRPTPRSRSPDAASISSSRASRASTSSASVATSSRASASRSRDARREATSTTVPTAMTRYRIWRTGLDPVELAIARGVEDEDRVEDDRDDRRREPADQAAEPCGQDGRGHEQDVARVAADRLVEAGLDGDRGPADEQAGQDTTGPVRSGRRGRGRSHPWLVPRPARPSLGPRRSRSPLVDGPRAREYGLRRHCRRSVATALSRTHHAMAADLGRIADHPPIRPVARSVRSDDVTTLRSNRCRSQGWRQRASPYGPSTTAPCGAAAGRRLGRLWKEHPAWTTTRRSSMRTRMTT